MLRKFNTSRTLEANMKLGGLTAFAAGMVNVASVMAFFAFTSNVTGHVAILAEEVARGHWHQVSVVFGWLALFFTGSFMSNFMIINTQRTNNYISHSIPLILEMMALLAVGIYGNYYYQETLFETEFLVAFMLFAMGLQNGLTASISNHAVKTTHLTGLFTDLAISLSLYTKKRYRHRPQVVERIKLLSVILLFYFTGGVISGLIYLSIGFSVFYYVCAVLSIVLFYDLTVLTKLLIRRRIRLNKIKSAAFAAREKTLS